ncbi:alpha/beta fold hydrolase [Ramlibacter sp.]|uniref:alpha/beta fold hydrolase n=1 Tax=Ramlibacter sp. TaxID=1917967 RepID=UPI003D0FC3FB
MKSSERERLPGTPEPMTFWEGDGGVAIAGDVWGDPDAPLVILLHGGGQTRHAWRGTGERLGEAGWRAIALDARGHGDSGWAEDVDYSIDAQVRDLQAVVRAEGGRRPALVGASMGGVCSLAAIGEGHVDATALILVDVVPSTEPAGVHRIQSFMRDGTEGFDSLEEIAQAIGSYKGSTLPAGERPGLAKNVRRGKDGRYYFHYDPRYAHSRRSMEERRARLTEASRNLRLPTLLVRGGASDVVSEEGVRDFLALAPHAEYVNVAEAGHMVAGDRNDAFGRAAVEFLARAVPPRSAHGLQSTAPDTAS